LRLRHLLSVLPIVLLSLAGCAVNPATGERSFTGFMSEAQEVEVGRETHPKILAEFGGAYDNVALQRYVESIGELLASTTERPDIDFTFTVIDSPIINAFALPGGYVYVTRGLLALADNEAEVASVVGHEIGHVIARHSAQRYSRSVLAQIGAIGLGIATGSGELANLAGSGAAVYLQSFSRDQEFEADTLGIRYMARANFDPQAAADFLAKLQAHSQLEATLAGQPESTDKSNIMATHPRTVDRVQRAIENAGATQVTNPILARDIYLDKIDGMLYGESPSQGVVRGRRFLHPDLRFAFEVPEGFTLHNNPNQVVAQGPGDALIVFDLAPKPGSGSMLTYLTRGWAGDMDFTDAEQIEINGMEAATGSTSLRTQQGPRDVRLVAIRYDAETVYRFMFLTPPDLTEELSLGLRETTYSFRRLSEAEAAAIEPLRVKIITVRPGDTVESLAEQMPFGDYREERFRVLNDLPDDAELTPGQRVKIISE
jgi:predicted Zn-dependent protease